MNLSIEEVIWVVGYFLRVEILHSDESLATPSFLSSVLLIYVSVLLRATPGLEVQRLHTYFVLE